MGAIHQAGWKSRWFGTPSQRSPLNRVLVDIALVERERARRTFGLFFEIFSQRGTTFAPALAAYDVVAQDCYTAVREAAPRLFAGRC